LASSNESSKISKSLVHLPSVLEQVLAETRIRYCERHEIEIQGENLEVYDAFVEASKPELAAVIANLLDNAVQALNGAGKVILALTLKKNALVFEIKDNGKGIPAEILPMLMTRGFSHEKPGGKGLGLSHARTTLFNWHGDLKIQSKIGIGTTVSISLPKAHPPQWFAQELLIEPGTEIIIVDDDSLIHEMWDFKLGACKNITINHFLSPRDFKASMMGRDLRFEKRIYLMDYEFRGCSENGIDLIEEFNIQLESYLVTGRHSDEVVMMRVEELGLRQIPKDFLNRVSLKFEQNWFDSEAAGNGSTAALNS
jgi:hypothetical protein